MKITIGGKEFTLSPLKLNQIRKLAPEFKVINDMAGMRVPSEESTDAVLKIVQSALIAEHPDVTTEELGDLLDIANFPDVLKSVFDVAGFKSQSGNAAAR